MSTYDDASLVLVPSGYKNGVVFSQKPMDANGQLTFTRASGATRVGPNGYIEKVRENLVLQSNQFDTTWTKGLNTTLTAGFSDPFGGSSAWRLTMGSGGGTFLSQSLTFSAVPYTLSVWAKSNGNTNITLIIAGSAETPFVLTNDWQRISFTYTPTAGTGDITIGNGASSVDALIYGAQFETGDVATDYIPTTTAAVSVGPVSGTPRLDYLNGECPSLLLEPQTTALNQFSEQIDNAYWGKENVTITANSVTSPDGYTNADTLTDDTTNGRHRIRPNTLSFTSGTSYTLSAFVKKNSSGRFLLLNAASAANARAVLNLDTLEIRNLSGTGKVEDYGNGWYRFSVTGTATVTQSAPVFIQMQNADTDDNYVGNGSSFYLWGINLTATSYPQSYIPTLSTSVTRVADIATKTGISSLLGGTEGTLMVEVDYQNLTSTIILVFGASGSGNGLGFAGTITNALRVKVNGVNDIIASVDTSLRHKVALAFNASGVVCYVNGSPITLPNGGSEVVSGLDEFILQTSTRYNELNVYQVYYSQTRLTNQQLQELTSL